MPWLTSLAARVISLLSRGCFVSPTKRCCKILQKWYNSLLSTTVQHGYIYIWMEPWICNPGARKDILPVARAGPCTNTFSVLGRWLDRGPVLRDPRWNTPAIHPSIPFNKTEPFNARTRVRIAPSIIKIIFSKRLSNIVIVGEPYIASLASKISNS